MLYATTKPGSDQYCTKLQVSGNKREETTNQGHTHAVQRGFKRNEGWSLWQMIHFNTTRRAIACVSCEGLSSATPCMGRFDITASHGRCEPSYKQKTKETNAAHVGTNVIKQITGPKWEMKTPVCKTLLF